MRTDIEASPARPQPAWVVCASTADWDAGLWTNKQHLMSRLADRGFSVLYIDSPGLRAPSARSGRDLRRMSRRLAGWSPVAKPARPGVWRDAPLLIPLHRHRSVRPVNDLLQGARLRRNVARYGIAAPVLWVYAPTALALAQACRARAVVYHCVDDLAAFPAIDASVGEIEGELILRADVCVASSRPLAARLKERGAREILYWPNCADTRAYAAVPRRPKGTGERPVAGFIGAVQEHKIDVELLAEVARRLPGWDVQLVGPVGEGLQTSSFTTAPLPANVHLLGPRSRGDLPEVVAGFDVAVIPYRLNDYTRCVFPMKVFEYLAGGVPVVSTLLPSLVGEVDHVTFAATPEAWADALESVRSGDGPGPVQARREYAAAHSWELRGDEAAALLGRWLPAPSAAGVRA